jgi:hypothetical protein
VAPQPQLVFSRRVSPPVPTVPLQSRDPTGRITSSRSPDWALQSWEDDPGEMMMAQVGRRRLDNVVKAGVKAGAGRPSMMIMTITTTMTTTMMMMMMMIMMMAQARRGVGVKEDGPGLAHTRQLSLSTPVLDTNLEEDFLSLFAQVRTLSFFCFFFCFVFVAHSCEGRGVGHYCNTDKQ